MNACQNLEKTVSEIHQNNPGKGLISSCHPGEGNRQLLLALNNNHADFPFEKRIGDFLRDHAQMTPGKTAIACLDSQLTFHRLNERVNQLARHLRNIGLREEQTVGLLLERSILLVESILAIWEAGGAYIPIETDYPAQRIHEILKDSCSNILLSCSWHVTPELATNYAGKIINPGHVPGSFPAGSAAFIEPNHGENRTDNLAYVIYTSGSTGKAKGAIIEHIGMMNHMWAKINDLQLTSQSIVAQNASHAFDISIWQFFAAMIVGGKTQIYPHQIIMEPEKFLARITRDRVTVLEVVPSYLAILLDSEDTVQNGQLNLDFLLVTGEEIKFPLVERWFKRHPGIKMVNAYGPTEASDDITHYIMDKLPVRERISIGSPIQNFQIYIVDENMNLCSPGTKGEIWAAGIGVGRGYLNNPELTNEKFIMPSGTSATRNPFEKGFLDLPKLLFNHHLPMYRTGDLGCRLPDGTIDFFGRIDHQVKIRGFRIELGDIERRLLAHESLKDAVVIDREDEPGKKYLCAYLVTAGEKLSIPDVKAYLLSQLPDYMVPSKFVEIEKLPLTGNGKIDRKNLPAPGTPGTAQKTPMVYITVEMMKMCDRESKHYNNNRNNDFDQEPMTEEFTLTPAEKEQILLTFNNTKAEFPENETVHGLFARQAQKTPAKAALIFNHHRVTYRELDERTDRLKWYLASRGAGHGTIIGIMAYRAMEMMIGLLAILKVGGAYLSIDPDYPRERIEYMLKDSCTRILLTNTMDRVNGVNEFLPLIIDLNNQENDTGQPMNFQALPDTDPGLFAVLYTSGTTGTPKGAILEHRGIINRLNWMQKAYPLDQKDVLLQKTPLVFDVSIWELFWWGFHGASLCILNPGDEVNPGAVIGAIHHAGVTTIHYVPSMFIPFLEHLKNPENSGKVAGLRQIFASGEALTTHHVTLFNDLLNNVYGTKLINLYGPTEASVDVSYFNCPAAEAIQKVPIGKPIDNIQLYILDKNNRLLPIGKIGELSISGTGLARGYINRPELTAEKFISNPFVKGEKIYKTGDLALWMSDGNIEFIGRKDHQVKMKGIRIEIGEIENCLLKHEHIKDAIVVTREDEQGEKYLMAYLLSPLSLIERDLRNYLSRELPRYMIPTSFVQLEQIPLMPNGKVNRTLLQKIKIKKETKLTNVTNETNETINNEIEKELAKIWAEVLNMEEIAVSENAHFFQLGGDSILALQAAIKARQVGIVLSSHQVFQYPCIKDLAAVVKSQAKKKHGLKKSGHFSLLQIDEKEMSELNARFPGLCAVYPLTPIQQQMLSYTLLVPDRGATVMQLSWIISGELDIHAFIEAWQTAACQHSILRTGFKNRRLKEPVMLLFNSVTIPFQQLDCSGMSAEQQYQAIKEYELDDKKQGFKLAQVPLMRLCLVILNKRRYRFICSYSALLLDNWSANLMVNDVFRFYDSYINKKARLGQALEEKSPPFADYVHWLLNHDPSDALDFWRQQLENFNAPVEFIPRFTAGDTPVSGFLPGQTEIKLLPLEVSHLTALANQYHLTPATILQGAWVIALSRFTGQDDVLSGVLSYGRPEQVPGIDAMVGLFINTVPVRTKIPRSGDLIAWLREFQDNQVRLRGFDYMSFADIAVGNRALLAKIQTAIYERTFVLVKHPGEEFLSGLSHENPIKINEYDNALIMDVPLRVYAELLGDDIIIRLRYDQGSLSLSYIEELAEHFGTVLRQGIKQPGIKMEDIVIRK
ncbi:MAG: amino acid adenylation domain-containing protein [Acidobacteria bacterium]|nr:amino acid adenylation domain-containing protein [Acidobacteriota bacterium]